MSDAQIEPVPVRPRRRTATSAFGVSRRESHDASAFYARFTAPVLSNDEDVQRPTVVDRLWVGDARRLDEVADIVDRSVALVVTSPPYFAGKEYEAALGTGHVPASYADYLQMLTDVFAACCEKLEPGGRIAVNVANLGRKPFRSLAADVTTILQELGLLLRGEVVWRKQLAAGGSCAWGTYQRPGNPVLRDLTERVVIASKGRFDRAIPAARRQEEGLPHLGSMTMDEFVDATVDLWDIPAESARRVGHPAPFPVELPRRLIELYTYRDDLVLDPFMGSGSTAIAALRTGRHYVGVDTDAAYVAAAEARIEAERDRLAAEPTGRAVVVRPARGRGGHQADDEPDPFVRGDRAADVAAELLRDAGFHSLERDVTLLDLGVSVAFRARDAAGRTWLFDLAGGFSAARPGLRRPDGALRTVGTAAVIASARTGAPGRTDLGPFVVLAADLPGRGTAAERLLAASLDPGPIAGVVGIVEPDARARLVAYASG